MNSLRQALVISGEKHQLIPYSKNRKRQIECKYCRWFSEERKLTIWKCSECRVYDLSFGFWKNRACLDFRSSRVGPINV